MRLLSPYECATLNVLRARSWRWLALDEIVGRAQLYQRRTPARTVRHHVGRFTDARLVSTIDGFDDVPSWRGPFYRWNPDAPAATVASIERAAQAESLLLEPVAEPPTACARGHSYAETAIADGTFDRLQEPSGYNQLRAAYGVDEGFDVVEVAAVLQAARSCVSALDLASAAVYYLGGNLAVENREPDLGEWKRNRATWHIIGDHQKA